MQSRLLETLLTQAQTSSDKVQWSRAICRAATHLARTGEHEHALRSLKGVRAQFGPGLHPEVASWLMLAEGILHFCQFDQASAYDRIQRAYALAVAFKHTAAIPTCAAWMALIEFNTVAHDKMVTHLVEATTLADKNDHQALARACLVAACAFHFGGDFARARPWYERAHRHATTEGDEATLGAMLFNMPTFRMVGVRLDDAFGIDAGAEGRRVVAEAASSFSFDYMTNNSNQEAWKSLLRGQHLVVERKYEEALQTLSAIDTEAVGSEKTSLVIAADKAWCAANLDQFELARVTTERTLAGAEALRDLDDSAFVLGRIAQVLALLGRVEEAALVRTRASIALAGFRQYQTVLLSKLDCLKLPV